jgi:hypothetical protein
MAFVETCSTLRAESLRSPAVRLTHRMPLSLRLPLDTGRMSSCAVSIKFNALAKEQGRGQVLTLAMREETWGLEKRHLHELRLADNKKRGAAPLMACDPCVALVSIGSGARPHGEFLPSAPGSNHRLIGMLRSRRIGHLPARGLPPPPYLRMPSIRVDLARWR